MRESNKISWFSLSFACKQNLDQRFAMVLKGLIFNIVFIVKYIVCSVQFK